MEKQKEVIKYLIFGVLTTLVYISVRWIIFSITSQVVLSAILANIIAITFAFLTNDSIVFNQEKQGKLTRFFKFVLMRLVSLLLDVFLAFLLVKKFPSLIGQFVHHDISSVNLVETLFSQVLIIVLNYIFSKVFVFNNKKE